MGSIILLPPQIDNEMVYAGLVRGNAHMRAMARRVLDGGLGRHDELRELLRDALRGETGIRIFPEIFIRAVNDGELNMSVREYLESIWLGACATLQLAHRLEAGEAKTVDEAYALLDADPSLYTGRVLVRVMGLARNIDEALSVLENKRFEAVHVASGAMVSLLRRCVNYAECLRVIDHSRFQYVTIDFKTFLKMSKVDDSDEALAAYAEHSSVLAKHVVCMRGLRGMGEGGGAVQETRSTAVVAGATDEVWEGWRRPVEWDEWQWGKYVDARKSGLGHDTAYQLVIGAFQRVLGGAGHGKKRAGFSPK